MMYVSSQALKRSPGCYLYVGQAESICLALLTFVTNVGPVPCIQTADQVLSMGPILEHIPT
jgi:hypothetical protein